MGSRGIFYYKNVGGGVTRDSPITVKSHKINYKLWFCGWTH